MLCSVYRFSLIVFFVSVVCVLCVGCSLFFVAHCSFFVVLFYFALFVVCCLLLAVCCCRLAVVSLLFSRCLCLFVAY